MSFRGGYDQRRDEGRGRPAERGGPGFPRRDDDRSRSRSTGPNVRQKRPKESEPYPVKTNYYKINFEMSDGEHQWLQYYAQIAWAKRDKDTGIVNLSLKKGKLFADDADDQGSNMAQEKSSPLSRRILLKLQRELAEKKIFFVTDGSNIVYAPKCLWDHPINKEEAHDIPPEVDMGAYGPQDDGSGNLQISPPPKFSADFVVKTCLQCDDDDPDASYVRRNGWFIVHLTYASKICFQVAKNKISSTDQAQHLSHAVNIAIRNDALSKMVSFGRSPRMFLFKPHEQHEILGRDLVHSFLQSNLPGSQLFAGLWQTAKITKNYDVFAGVNLGVTAICPAYDTRSGENAPIPLLQVDGDFGSIIGLPAIKFRLDRPIPSDVRGLIEGHLKNETFDVRYKFLKDDGSYRKTVQKYKRLYKVDKGDRSVFWAANDAGEYCFDWNEQQVTVCQYYAERYKIELKYPSMPLLRVSKIELFPLEFFYQAFTEKKKLMNSAKDDVLRFHDKFASSLKLNQITSMLGKLSTSEPSILSHLGLSRNADPLNINAKVLQEPRVVFGHQKETKLNNGSFNIKGQTFYTASKLTSFAIVDLTLKNTPTVSEYLTHVLQACARHGIDISEVPPNFSNLFQNLVCYPKNKVNLDDPNVVAYMFKEAIAKARAYFIDDVNHVFHQRFHESKVVLDQGIFKCKVIPGNDNSVGLIFERSERYNSHTIVLKNGNCIGARLYYEDANGVGYDPFENQRKFNVKRHTYVFQGENDDGSLSEITIPDTEIDSITIDYILNDRSRLDCPAIIFVYQNESSPKFYILGKFLANVVHGMQSQVGCRESFKKQGRNTESYFSNIALKLNAKLSCLQSAQQAISRISRYSNDVGLPWISEGPTMIVGLSVSKVTAQDPTQLVAATATLDAFGCSMCQELQVQIDNPTIRKSVIISIFQELTTKFRKANNVDPARLLVYRSSVPEGLFAELFETEIKGIRQVFFQNNCEVCHSNNTCGCSLCTPPITYIVTQSDDIRLSPFERNSKENVLSGTYLDDHGVLSYLDQMSRLDEHTEMTNFDFILVAQSGNKGTSKPVFYRSILNENFSSVSALSQGTRLTKPKLVQLTYALSHQYATATKVTRMVPVLVYCSKLLNVAAGYVDHLQLEKCDDEEKYKSTRYPKYLSVAIHPHTSA